jgi:hypothetical protein
MADRADEPVAKDLSPMDMHSHCLRIGAAALPTTDGMIMMAAGI